MDDFRKLLFIFPVMGYYFLESVVLGIFVWSVWRFFLQDFTGIEIGYVQWVALIWIIKVIFFDVFKLISGVGTMNNPNDENQQEQR